MSINWEDPRSDESDQSNTGEATKHPSTSSDAGSDTDSDTDSESIETAVASIMSSDTSGSTTEDESQPTDADTDPDTESSEGSDSAFSGFASGGMTVTETITAVVFAAGAWWTAYALLMQIVAHGTHHAPNMLWGAFLLLIATPLFLVMGTSVGARMFDMATQVRSGSQTNDDSNHQ